MQASIIRAVLLSALIFPGAGQLYLKRFKVGIILLATILVCFAVMVMSVLNTAMSAVQQIQMQGGIVDMSHLTQAATEATEQSANIGFNLSLVIIVGCWVYGIVDAIIAGKKAANK